MTMQHRHDARARSVFTPSIIARLIFTVMVAAALALVAVPGWAAGAKTSPDEAAAYMRDLGQKTITVLTDESITPSAREDRIRTILNDNFDLGLIGRFVVGSAWRKSNKDQRVKYQTLFKSLILRTYSKRLAGYGGRQMEIVDAKPFGKRDALVVTRFERSSDKPLLVSWRIRTKKDHHKIIDMMVAGVSMVVTQKAEFRTVIRRNGMDGLIAMLQDQVASLETAPQKPVILVSN